MKRSSDILKISRDVTDAIVSNKSIHFQKEHTYMFMVSRFIAQKEQIIRKSSGNYYDSNDINLENDDYLPIILYIYNTFGRDINVDTKNNIYIDGVFLDKDIVYYNAIWFFAKIRDSFCHGGYDFDTNNETIKIDNREFGINIEIPVYMFDYISFYINEINDGNNSTLKEIEEKYKSYLNISQTRKIYGNGFNKTKAMGYASAINKKIKEIYLELGLSRGLSKGRGSSNNFIDLQDQVNYHELIENLINLINSSNLSSTEKDDYINRLYSYIEKISDISKLFDVIEEIEFTLKSNVKQAVLYNHSCMVFNFIPNSVITKFDISSGIITHFNPEHNCSIISNCINNICISFISWCNNDFYKSITSIKNRSSYDKIIEICKSNLILVLSKLEEMIFTGYNSYSKNFASSVRNGIFHLNYFSNGDDISIIDRSDNISGSIPKFELSSNVYEYDNFLRSIEKTNEVISTRNILEYTSDEFIKCISFCYKLITGFDLDYRKTIDEIKKELNLNL